MLCRLKSLFYLLSYSLSAVLLLSCADTRTVDPVAAAYLQRRATELQLTQPLTSIGVQIINIGEDYLMIIPADVLFYPQSPRIYWSNYRVLNNVVAYLKFFRKVTVKVAGYTSVLGSEKRNAALSLARARNVANYLWSQDVDTRLMYIRGYGSHRLMYGGHPESRLNERIEIMFRDP